MSLRPLEGQSPIHTEEARRSTQKLAARRRLLRCEVYNPPNSIGGFGRERSAMRPLGNVKCAISQLLRTSEITPNSDTSESVVEYEIALPARVHVEPSSRVFVPAKYPEWKANYQYLAGQLVVATNWINGRTMVFRSLKNAQSGVLEPSWQLSLRSQTVDGAALWLAIYEATIYEVISINNNESNFVETVVRAKELNS